MASIQSIIAATDFSEEARYGAERAGIVVGEEERQEAVKHIKELIRNSDEGASRTSYAVEYGGASRVILAKEEERSADLIVIGKHGRSMVEEWLLGRVTRHVLADSKSDVLVVHERALR